VRSCGHSRPALGPLAAVVNFFVHSFGERVSFGNCLTENLRMIESAKRKVAQDRGQAIGDVSWSEVLKEMNLREMPRCPDGGEYSLSQLGSLPRCTIGGNATRRVEDDHMITY